jgi:hypothetical protein
VVDPAVVPKREGIHPEPEGRAPRRTAETGVEGGHHEQWALTRASAEGARSTVQSGRASRGRFYRSPPGVVRPHDRRTSGLTGGGPPAPP